MELQNAENNPIGVEFRIGQITITRPDSFRPIETGLDLGTLRLLEIDGARIGICSNDAAEYPEDSPAELLKRSINKNYSFKYLIDEDQSIARRFGAVCTPDFFVYDQNNLLFYRGRLDDSWRNSEKVKNEELWLAIQRHLSGQKVEEQIPAMGCSIKWKAKK